MKTLFRMLSKSEARRDWQLYKPTLANICESDASQSLDTQMLYDDVISGRYVLFRADKGGSMVGCGILSFEEYGGEKSLYIVGLGGGDIKEWLADVVEYGDFLAEGFACTGGVFFRGRLGWQKLLAEHGYRVGSVLMIKKGVSCG